MITLTFYSEILNHHQVHIADNLYDILGDNFRFVEVIESSETKGCLNDYSSRPYLVKAWLDNGSRDYAFKCAKESDVCVFDGYETLPYQKVRDTTSKLSFELSERWLKKGLLNIFSPRLLHTLLRYYISHGKHNKYKLCASAYAANDQYLFKTFLDKCYKWGYFIPIQSQRENNKQHHQSFNNAYDAHIMWCSRLIKWKHPELAVMLAYNLKLKGINVKVHMYGAGPCLPNLQRLSSKFQLENNIVFYGRRTNYEIHAAMRENDIFILTSDQNEGWGVVLNEAMSNGCAVVVSDMVGAAPFLIEHGKNGLLFESENIRSLCDNVEYLILNPTLREKLSLNAIETIREVWSPRIAAENLVHLSRRILLGKDSDIMYGPCSKAFPI